MGYRYKTRKVIKPGSIIIKTSFALLPTKMSNNKMIFWRHYTQEYEWCNHGGVSRDFNWTRIPNTKEIKTNG